MKSLHENSKDLLFPVAQTSVKAKVDELLTRRKRVDSSLSMDDMAGFIFDSIEQAEKQGE